MRDSKLFDFEGLLEFPNLHSVNNQNTSTSLRLSLRAHWSGGDVFSGYKQFQFVFLKIIQTKKNNCVHF